MKQSSLILTMVMLALCPTAVWAQRTQTLPDDVTEVVLRDYQNLTIVAGEQTRLSTSGDAEGIAEVRGNRLKLTDDYGSATLSVSPGRVLTLRASALAKFQIEAPLSIERLELHLDDYASATFTGAGTDTASIGHADFHTEDFAHIASQCIVQASWAEFTAEDFSRITLTALDMVIDGTDSSANLSRNTLDYATIVTGRTSMNGVFSYDDADSRSSAYNTMYRMLDRVAKRPASEPKRSEGGKRHSAWQHGAFDLDFSWGWHNWGPAALQGLSGVEGNASVGTTFNNISLGGKWAIAETDYVGFYAGLALEWDKWKFTQHVDGFDLSASPRTFAVGSAEKSPSMLTTRYVEVPLSVRIGSRNGVHLILAAIPGINWSASGLTYRSNSQTIKDRSINAYLNPYKLDVRAELRFKRFGVYVQTATLPVLREGNEPLFPMMFGFTI